MTSESCSVSHVSHSLSCINRRGRLRLPAYVAAMVLMWTGSALADASASAPSAASPIHPPAAGPAAHAEAPSLPAALPFTALLLSIALLPLIPRAAHWWHHNRNKLIVSLVLAGVTLIYYLARGTGFGHGELASTPGAATLIRILHHSVVQEYTPFMVLLFSLYTICGGVQLRGDLRATPLVNTAFLGCGALLASFVGTTGASMLLIRPLLQTNRERARVKHTVIFFIFLVSNIGGCLLPLGDPPLFLGYLMGVKFLWTLHLWKEWLFCCVVLLTIYYFWDKREYARETPLDHLMDETKLEPLRVRGLHNVVWLAGVVLAVALIVPDQRLIATHWYMPNHLREVVLLILVGLAWITSSPEVRRENDFNFGAIIEVAVLFIGIFITMQAPIEILQIKGPSLGLSDPVHFFWATGVLSSFLDNAPTYVVFFETAKSLPGIDPATAMAGVEPAILVGISLGAVFMGANTYIGNGPNFMVKSIAESAGVKMPSFFGFMLYSVSILIPTFLLVMWLFL